MSRLSQDIGKAIYRLRTPCSYTSSASYTKLQIIRRNAMYVEAVILTNHPTLRKNSSNLWKTRWRGSCREERRDERTSTEEGRTMQEIKNMSQAKVHIVNARQVHGFRLKIEYNWLRRADSSHGYSHRPVPVDPYVDDALKRRYQK